MNTPLHLFGTRAGTAAIAAALALSLAGVAHAQVACSSLPNPVYVAGSSAVGPFATGLAADLANAATPISVIYKGPGSCVGVSYVTSTPAPALLTGGGTYWDKTLATPAMVACATSDSTGGAGDPVDIGVSDVYAASCTGPLGGAVTLGTGVVDYHGPVQTMTFVVPGGSSGGSSKSLISAEAAYLVFGFAGSSHAVSPWDTMTYIHARKTDSGTEQMIAHFLDNGTGLAPAEKWQAIKETNSAAVVSMVNADKVAAFAEKSIGILSTGDADAHRANTDATPMKVLQYQHFGQDCGYLPDSSSTSFDKLNVRDGHYAIWGHLHMYTAKYGTNANVKKVVDYLTGAAKPGFDLIQTEAKKGVVPDCAMMVQHTQNIDGSPLKAYSPSGACGCKFEKEATGMTSCTVCTAADFTKDATHCTDKAKPYCNYGYCEAK